jgi:hypothetical protein
VLVITGAPVEFLAVRVDVENSDITALMQITEQRRVLRLI